MRIRCSTSGGVIVVFVTLWVCLPAGAEAAETVVRASATPQTEFVVPVAPPEAIDEARHGKQILERLVGNDDMHARDLGFKSAAEAANTKTDLGIVFPIVRVDFGKLLAFRPDNDPRTLLVPTNEFLYPVTVKGKVRSSLRVKRVGPNPQTGKEWRTIVWGASELVQLLDQTKKIVLASPSSFAVWIPELNRYFLGDIRDGKIVIIPIVDDPRLQLQFKAGVSLPAETVFERLVPEAKKRIQTEGAG